MSAFDANRLEEVDQSLKSRLSERLSSQADPDLHEQLCRMLENYPKFSTYNMIPEEARRWVAELARGPQANVEGLAIGRAILFFMRKGALQIEQSSMPAEIKSLYHLYFERILENLQKPAAENLKIGDDKVLKDLGIVQMRLIPVGAWVVDRSAILSKRFLLQGPGRFVFGLMGILRKLGGFRPVFIQHLDSRYTGEFNEQGCDRSYLRIAALLRVYPEVRGVASCAWYNDPQMSWVSPHLAHMYSRFKNHGACLFNLGESEYARELALATSRTRNRLYTEGRYRPTTWLAVWGRRNLLDWARANAHLATAEVSS